MEPVRFISCNGMTDPCVICFLGDSYQWLKTNKIIYFLKVCLGNYWAASLRIDIVISIFFRRVFLDSRHQGNFFSFKIAWWKWSFYIPVSSCDHNVRASRFSASKS